MRALARTCSRLSAPLLAHTRSAAARLNGGGVCLARIAAAARLPQRGARRRAAPVDDAGVGYAGAGEVRGVHHGALVPQKLPSRARDAVSYAVLRPSSPGGSAGRAVYHNKETARRLRPMLRTAPHAGRLLLHSNDMSCATTRPPIAVDLSSSRRSGRH